MWILGICGLLAAEARVEKPPKVVLEVRGYILPIREVSISPRVGGIVVKLPIEEGKRVKKGEVLARLDDTDFQLDLKYARAKLKLAQARLVGVQKGGRGERDILEAEVGVAMVDVEKAQRSLDALTVVAPWDGTILQTLAVEGALVLPQGGGGLASRICTMADLTELEVDVAIAERDIHRISKGQKCSIRAEAYPERAYMGEVSRIMPVADRSKGAIQVRVRIAVPANDERLRPEMGAVAFRSSVKSE